MVYSSYVKQRILLFRREGKSFRKIAGDLAKEGHVVSKSGVALFFKKYAKEGSIGRKPGSGLTGKKTAALFKLVDSHMEKDDELSAYGAFLRGFPALAFVSIFRHVATNEGGRSRTTNGRTADVPRTVTVRTPYVHRSDRRTSSSFL